MNDEKEIIQPISFKIERNYSLYQSNCVEFWVPVNPNYIPNLANRYWISSCGRIIDTFAYYGKGKILYGSYDSKQYLKITLIDVNGIKYCRKIHRLVMMSFYYFPGCENYEVNHKDGNHENNNLYNLEWVTPSENRLHSVRTGLEPTIFGSQIALLSDEEVWKIRGLALQKKYTNNQIIKILGLEDRPSINRRTIERIVHETSSLYRPYWYTDYENRKRR